jgi:hypothetical protein
MRAMKALWVVLAGGLLLCTGLAVAQEYYGGWGAGYPTYHHASTAAEGAARGMADVTRSAGMYNLATSEAAINVTEAQSNYIKNRDEWTNTYFQMREANRQYRAKERGPRPSMEDLVRYAQAGKPARLSPSELDTVSGDVSWPSILQKEEFAKQRAQLEALFAKRAADGSVGPEQLAEIRRITGALIDQLKEQLQSREVSQMDYIGAKRFLESLSFEGQTPVG